MIGDRDGALWMIPYFPLAYSLVKTHHLAPWTMVVDFPSPTSGRHRVGVGVARGNLEAELGMTERRPAHDCHQSSKCVMWRMGLHTDSRARCVFLRSASLSSPDTPS